MYTCVYTDYNNKIGTRYWTIRSGGAVQDESVDKWASKSVDK